MSPRRLLLVPLLLCFALGGCMSISTSTSVKGVWKDPKFSGPPLRKIFVISLMKIQPGGRDAVEDAIVAKLKAAGTDAVAAHTVKGDDTELIDAIRKSGADAVMMAQVRWLSTYEPYVVTETMASPSPDKMGHSDFFKDQGADEPGDYKVARIGTGLWVGAFNKQVWTAFTDSYDASNLARNIPDYTTKLVAALARDGMIVAPKPAN
jgi:nucleotide-binding universal stress UspA family protein